MSLGQFFPTNEMMSPFSMCLLFGLIPKLVPLEHFEEVSCKKNYKKTTLLNNYQEMTDVNLRNTAGTKTVTLLLALFTYVSKFTYM